MCLAPAVSFRQRGLMTGGKHLNMPLTFLLGLLTFAILCSGVAQLSRWPACSGQHRCDWGSRCPCPGSSPPVVSASSLLHPNLSQHKLAVWPL